MTTPRIATLLLVLSLPVLGACNSSSPPDSDAARAPDTFIGKMAAKGLNQAREELRSGNLNLNGELHIGDGVWSSDSADGLPRAEITPQGDLLIEGKAVAIDDAQRQLLLDYRHGFIGVADAGMTIGIQGADLAGKALSQGLASIFSGDQADFEARMEAQGKQIEAQAMQLCKLLPPLLQTQNTLAASLPEFEPYASLSQDDIDNCGNDEEPKAVDRTRIREEIRSGVRDGIRNDIRGAVQGITQAIGVASSGTGDTVEVNGIRFLLPPGGVSTRTTNGDTSIEVSNGLRVTLADGELRINGDRYPTPKANGEVDLCTDGTVKVDGEVVDTI